MKSTTFANNSRSCLQTLNDNLFEVGDLAGNKPVLISALIWMMICMQEEVFNEILTITGYGQ